MIASTRRHTVVANLVLAGGTTLVALAIVELMLRVLPLDVASYHAIASFTVYDPELGWQLAPSRTIVFTGAHFSARVVQNAEGLRDRSYSRARTPGRRRILVLGDSVVWCWGVEQAECFTERLEAALPETDVINAGVPAYSTAQEMLLYEREGRRYRSDLVLLVFVPNDVDENIGGRGPRFTLRDGDLVAPAQPVPRRKSVLQEWLQEHSRLFAQIDYWATASKVMWSNREAAARAKARDAAAPGSVQAPAYPLPPAERVDAAWTLTAALLDRILRDVRADGARFAMLIEETPDTLLGRLREFCASRGISCLEIGPLLAAAARRGEHVRLRGDPHISAAGQRIVADELRVFLERESLLSPPDRTR